MEYLIKGQDYLEQTKNFKLVGRNQEMDKLLWTVAIAVLRTVILKK